MLNASTTYCSILTSVPIWLMISKIFQSSKRQNCLEMSKEIYKKKFFIGFDSSSVSSEIFFYVFSNCFHSLRLLKWAPLASNNIEWVQKQIHNWKWFAQISHTELFSVLKTLTVTNFSLSLRNVMCKGGSWSWPIGKA